MNKWIEILNHQLQANKQYREMLQGIKKGLEEVQFLKSKDMQGKLLQKAINELKEIEELDINIKQLIKNMEKWTIN